MRYTTYQQASEVGQADGNTYQIGQWSETVYEGKRIIKYLFDYHKGAAVWIKYGVEPSADQIRAKEKRVRAKRPALLLLPELRNPIGRQITARGTAKRQMSSTPNAPLNYKMGRKSA